MAPTALIESWPLPRLKEVDHETHGSDLDARVAITAEAWYGPENLTESLNATTS